MKEIKRSPDILLTFGAGQGFNLQYVFCENGDIKALLPNMKDIMRLKKETELKKEIVIVLPENLKDNFEPYYLYDTDRPHIFGANGWNIRIEPTTGIIQLWTPNGQLISTEEIWSKGVYKAFQIIKSYSS